MISLYAEDQYAVVSGETTLIQLEDALPVGLQYRAPRLAITLEDWLLSAGVGLLEAAPVRQDVLGLTYRAAHDPISVGGRVVKNVAGYDLVRLVIGSDSSLSRRVRILEATVRLRPKLAVTRLEQIKSNFSELRQLGANYAVAYRHNNAWVFRAEFWGQAPAWGSPASSDLTPETELHDMFGVFPRAKRELSGLEARVLNAL